MKYEVITGAEIEVGDVFRSAAMYQWRKAVRIVESSTGRTVQVLTVDPMMPVESSLQRSGWTGRIGKDSKVKRQVKEEA